MKLPEVAKYDKISKEAYPHLKWGSTGFKYLDNNKLGKDRKTACWITVKWKLSSSVRHNENGKKWVTHKKCGTK